MSLPKRSKPLRPSTDNHNTNARHRARLRDTAIIALGFAAATLLVPAWHFATDLPFDTPRFASTFEGGLRSWPVVLALVRFFLVVIGLHLVLAVVWQILGLPFVRYIKPPEQERRANNVMFSLFLGWVLVTNNGIFPLSSFAVAPTYTLARLVLLSIWIIATFIFLCVGVFSIYRRLLTVRDLASRSRPSTMGAIGALLGVAIGLPLWLNAGAAQAPGLDKPNVIIIGIDELRPDHVGAINPERAHLTPNLDRALQGATIFRNAWTPLARTYPAWVSILTGRYPPRNGARYNNTARRHIDASQTLSKDLDTLSYQSVFAIDNRHFVHIDESYGFDRINRRHNAAEFVIEKLSDIPVVNLSLTNQAGQYLFPLLYANRAVGGRFQPTQYANRLRRMISRLDPGRPAFIATHSTIPHHPGKWAGFSSYRPDPMPSKEDSSLLYKLDIQRADQQVGNMLRSLKEAGRLDNAIVIFMSDHGQSFERSMQEWHPGENSQGETHIPGGAGHGTSVFNPSQYHSFLAIRGFGRMAGRIPSDADRNDLVSLADIRPTVMSLLDEGKNARKTSTARALFHDQDGANAHPSAARRTVPLATGFVTFSLKVDQPDPLKLMRSASQYYQVADSGYLEMRPKSMERVLRRKQRAVTDGSWMLASVPPRDPEKDWRLILANFDTHAYWPLEDAPHKRPDDAPVQRLVHKLCSYYGDDPAFHEHVCTPSSPLGPEPARR